MWAGRRVTLFCDTSVVFGGQAVGGTRIAALSHIDKPKKIPLLVTRGKSAMFTVEPLKDEPQTVDLGPMFAALTSAGLGDKDAALTFISAQIGRDVASSKELTRDDAAKVTAALDAMLGTDQDAAETLPGVGAE